MTCSWSSLILLTAICWPAPAQEETSSHSQYAQEVTTSHSLYVTVATASLPAQTRNDIVAFITRYFANQPDASGLGRDIALNSKVSLLRLSRTGPRAILIASSNDDPNNGKTNREFWLFRRVGTHVVPILISDGWNATPKRNTYHHGILDLEVAGNLGATTGMVRLYRFNGVRYESSYCYDYTLRAEGEPKYGPHRKCND